MAEATPPRPLRANDDRAPFDCGVASMNGWFLRHAWENHVSGASRVNVICDRGSGAVIGYVTLSAAQIGRAFLVKKQQRNQPDPLPATLIGQLAVHRDHQSRGHSSALLKYALQVACRSAELVGSIGVMVNPLDDGVRGFYAKWGFEDLPHDPRNGMMVRMVEVSKLLSGS